MNRAMASLLHQGRLDEVPLPRLLLDLYKTGFAGSLTLSRARTGKRFLFQNGWPVFAESNLASESLGVQLMDAGRLDRRDFNRVTELIESEGCQEGAALLELDLLSPKELFVALKDQVRTRILECFGWPQGEFIVDSNGDPGRDAQPFRLDPLVLVQAGLETHWSGERILGDLGPHMECYVRPSRDFRAAAGHLSIDAAVHDVLDALDGSRTLWKAAQTARSPRALGALWLLDAVGALSYSDVPEPAAAPGAEIPLAIELQVRGEKTATRTGGSALGRSSDAGTRDRRENEHLCAEIAEKHAGLAELDHYALLGVARDATAGEIRKAYLSAAKAYHPDALARMNLESTLREQANRVFAAIGKAHALLGDVRERRDYDASLDTDSSDRDGERLAQAETLYRKAEILMRQGNFRGALEFLGPAVDIWPDDNAYQSAYGWALYKKMPSEPVAARERLECSLRLDPDDATTRFRLGVVLRDLNERDVSGSESPGT